MSEWKGGWVLDVRCTTCDATAQFRAVLLTLAAQQAIMEGWTVSFEPKVLVLNPGEREELCPDCTVAMG